MRVLQVFANVLLYAALGVAAWWFNKQLDDGWKAPSLHFTKRTASRSHPPVSSVTPATNT